MQPSPFCFQNMFTPLLDLYKATLYVTVVNSLGKQAWCQEPGSPLLTVSVTVACSPDPPVPPVSSSENGARTVVASNRSLRINVLMAPAWGQVLHKNSVNLRCNDDFVKFFPLTGRKAETRDVK